MNLDDAYANAPFIQGAERFLKKWPAEAAAYRKHMLTAGRAALAIPYGGGDRQRFDLFAPKNAPIGLCVFVHGGYWLKFSRSEWSHLARGMVDRGWVVAMPSYDLCPKVRISEITSQVAKAIAVAAENTEGPIVLAGHSAGGHLVARMCVAGVLPSNVAARVDQVLSISPVSDLRPLLNTSMNADFQMDEASAAAESPVLMTPMDIPVTVWVGADERPVFLDQARWLAEAWTARLIVDKGLHHFNVIDALEDPESEMVGVLAG